MSPQILAVVVVVVTGVCSLGWYAVIGNGLRRRETYSDRSLWRTPHMHLAGWGIATLFAMIGVYKAYEYQPAELAVYFIGLALAEAILVTVLAVLVSNRTTAVWCANMRSH